MTQREREVDESRFPRPGVFHRTLQQPSAKSAASSLAGFEKEVSSSYLPNTFVYNALETSGLAAGSRKAEGGKGREGKARR